MKIEKRFRERGQSVQFSGRVEVSITGLDDQGHRLSQGWRRSFRIEETTVDKVFEVIWQAIATKSNERES